MGTADFAIPSFCELVKKHKVEALITNPDSKKGRGMKLLPPKIKNEAQKKDVKVFQPECIKSKDIYNVLNRITPDLIVVVAYGQIVPKKILELPYYSCVNVHASLLPRYRGPAPIHWAIINGEDETGITTILMDEGIDTGDILLQRKIAILPTDTAGVIHDKLAVLGSELLMDTIEGLQKDTLKKIKQNDKEAIYAPILDDKIERINWKESAVNIFNLIRGLNPWPGAYTFHNKKRYKIWDAEVFQKDFSVDEAHKPGSVMDLKDNRGILVSTGKGILLITQMQPSGKKKMSAGEILKGYNMKKGDRFL